MALLKETDRLELSKALEKLDRPVRLVLFTEQGDKGPSEPNQIMRELVEEIVALSPKLSLELKDVTTDAELARSYRIERTPGMVVMADKDDGLRYFGVPAGHEFTGFIENLIELSGGEHHLPEAVLEQLARVDRPVRLEVLFTPG